MLTKNDRIVCDYCGKFISYAALEDGTARHKLDTPDSHFSCESYESYHKSCANQQSQKDAQ